jgi:hypothetical protein
MKKNDEGQQMYPSSMEKPIPFGWPKQVKGDNKITLIVLEQTKQRPMIMQTV